MEEKNHIINNHNWKEKNHIIERRQVPCSWQMWCLVHCKCGSFFKLSNIGLLKFECISRFRKTKCMLGKKIFPVLAKLSACLEKKYRYKNIPFCSFITKSLCYYCNLQLFMTIYNRIAYEEDWEMQLTREKWLYAIKKNI